MPIRLHWLTKSISATMQFRQPLFLALCMLASVVANAQKHDAFSFFGYILNNSDPKLGHYTIDFRMSPPKIVKQNKQINFATCCGSCSDSTG